MSQPDQRAKHLDEARAHLSEALFRSGKNTGLYHACMAIEALIDAQLPPPASPPKPYAHTCDSNPQAVCVACEAGEPKGETGEGERKCPLGQCDGSGRISDSDPIYAGWRCCKCPAGQAIYAPRPAHPPGALELSVEEWEALEMAVRAYPPVPYVSRRAHDAFRKLRARAGSEGARCVTVVTPSPPFTHNGVYYTNEPTPPAASETAKCGYCGGPVPCGPCHDGDARPSPETSPLPRTLPAGTRWRNPGESEWQTLPSDAIYDAQAGVYRWEQDEPGEKTWRAPPSLFEMRAPAISKSETVEADAGGDEDGAAANRAYWDAYGTGVLPVNHAHAHLRGVVGAYNAGRAESDGRVRELEKRAEVAESRLAEREQQLATLKAEKEAAEALNAEYRTAYEQRGETITAIIRAMLGGKTDGVLELDPVYYAEHLLEQKEAAESNRAELLSELAELRGNLAQSRSERGVLMDQRERERAAREAAEANRAEWIATNERAHAQAEELLEERNEARAKLEAAEARVRELGEVSAAVHDWVAATRAVDSTSGSSSAPDAKRWLNNAVDKLRTVAFAAFPRPQSPAPWTEGREG